MNAIQKYLLLSLLSVGAVMNACGELKGKEAELPLAAKSALQEMERAILAAKKKAVDKLKVVMKAEMQAGNLERANLVNQEIKQIGDLSDEPSTSKANEPVVGEWKRKDGTSILFDSKGVVVFQNGWSGTWVVQEKSIIVSLTMLGGKPAAAVNKLTYNLPVQKKVEDKMVWVLEAPKSPDFTGFRK